MTDQITLSAGTVALLSDTCKAEIAAHLGFAYAGPALPIAVGSSDGDEYAELGIQAARAFLQGCSARTREVLAAIVQSGDSFSLRQLEIDTRAEEGSLRGVWTGLTKRTRTITGDDEAYLIQWSEQAEDGDYTGRLTPVTLNAFKRALEE